MIVRTGYLSVEARDEHRKRVRAIREHSPVEAGRQRLYRLARADGYTPREAHGYVRTLEAGECVCLYGYVCQADEHEHMCEGGCLCD